MTKDEKIKNLKRKLAVQGKAVEYTKGEYDKAKDRLNGLIAELQKVEEEDE